MKKPLWKWLLNFLILISCIFYLMILYYFTIGKSSGGPVNGTAQAVNLVPFKTISEYVSYIVYGGDKRNIAISNLMGNVVLTIPMAVYIAYFIKRFRKFWRVIFVSLVAILAIETIQFITGHGTLDVDDVLLNLVGSAIGYGFWKLKPIQWLTMKCQL